MGQASACPIGCRTAARRVTPWPCPRSWPSARRSRPSRKIQIGTERSCRSGARSGRSLCTSIHAVERLKGRDFLRVADWSGEELLAVLDLSDRLKDERKRYVDEPLLPARSVGLFLEKPSLRTRVSFELAVHQLGGHAVHLTGQEVGLGGRESTRAIA